MPYSTSGSLRSKNRLTERYICISPEGRMDTEGAYRSPHRGSEDLITGHMLSWRPSWMSSTAQLTTHCRFCGLQMGVMLAVSLVDRPRVFSATECSGFFRIAKRYREVNLAQNEGHALGSKRGARGSHSHGAQTPIWRLHPTGRT